MKPIHKTITLVLAVFLLIVVAGSGCSPRGTTGSKSCTTNEDCVVFGEEGDCNCGCYSKAALPADSGGRCYCSAPASCTCTNNLCEGVYS